MARPRKDPADALTEQLPPVRVSVADRQRIEAKAAQAGLPVSAYIRRVAVTGKVTISNEINAAKMDAQTLAELNAMGNNFNQIAKHMNKGGQTPAAFGQMLFMLYQLLEKVSRRFDS